MKLDDVQRNYDRLARRYDFLNRMVFDRLLGLESWRPRAVGRVLLAEGQSVLDIACGTGLNLPLLRAAVGESGRVVGLDYSEGMLGEARQCVNEAGWQNVELVQGDAALLEGVGAPFDAVISTWALGIVDDLPSALTRAVDLLTPGGRLAVLDFHSTRPTSRVARFLNPIAHSFLRWSGVDAAEDLADGRLRERWHDGKEQLREALTEVEVVEYFHGTGFLLSGTKPDLGAVASTLGRAKDEAS